MQIKPIVPEPEIRPCNIMSKEFKNTQTATTPTAGPSSPVQTETVQVECWESTSKQKLYAESQEFDINTTEPTATDSNSGIATEETCSRTVKKRFGELFQPMKVLEDFEAVEQFYPDMKLTPFVVAPGVFHVLLSKTGLCHSTVSWIYSLISHGSLSHTWSLLPMLGHDITSNTAPIRPIGLLQTIGSDLNYGEARLTDLQLSWEATTIKLAHFYDSYSQEGTHVGFQVEDGYSYEWQLSPVPDGSGQKPLLLWRNSLKDRETRHLAAKLTQEQIIKNPCNAANLWCLEIDSDRISAHIALLSAFAIKECHSKVSSWFAKKTPELHPAVPLLNFSFQDDGRIMSRSNKFWGDWEEERQATLARDETESQEHAHVTIIKVFSPVYLQKFVLTERVLKRLNDECFRRVNEIRVYYSIR